MTRRRISLYIGGTLADLDSDSLVLMNYATDDLYDPAVVKNSYSQQVKLPNTASNNAIFNHIYRHDFRASTRFNPSLRVPFQILDDQSTLLESGYIKLNNVTTKNGKTTYDITLYGGLGSFFYSLSSSSDEDNQLTLADLPYTDAEDNRDELTFEINATNVREAWQRLKDGTTGAEKWDVINFAPAYNGYPSDNFTPDKGLIDPISAGLAWSVTENDTYYGIESGVSLVELGQEYTEWQTKDLRSYLQRPVLSVRKMIEAIVRFAERNGFTVILDGDFFNDSNHYWTKAWMTLPLINTIETKGGEIMETVDVNVESPTLPQASSLFNPAPSEVQLVPTNNKAGDVEIAMSMQMNLIVTGSWPKNEALTLARSSSDYSAIVVQLLGYDANGGIVAGSDIYVLTGAYAPEASEILDKTGYSILYPAEVVKMTGDIDAGEFKATPYGGGDLNSLAAAWNLEVPISLTMSGSNVHSAKLYVRIMREDPFADKVLWATSGEVYKIDIIKISNFIGTMTVSTPEVLRSGSVVTKELLLKTERTPMDYLLAYTKVFGLHYLYDKASKQVTITTRNNLYYRNDYHAPVDLTERIDRSKEVKVAPLGFDKKWYDFGFEYEGGAFVEEYNKVHGEKYGVQRVNTGYSFNAEAKDIIDGEPYTGAAEVCELTKYNINITEIIDDAERAIPSPFLDGGQSYNLYDALLNSKSIDIQPPSKEADITYFNNTFKGYDADSRLQLHDADNGSIEGAGVLVFLRGFANNDAYSRFLLTDDLPQMLALNGGEPCWILSPIYEGWLSTPIYQYPDFNLPLFGRYKFGAGRPVVGGEIFDPDRIGHSWDFGIPKEIDIPGKTHSADASIYARGWQAFITDRYNVDSRVCTVYIDLRGLQVGEELLRRIYYFDGAYWVLNKIINYSFTSSDTVQCEFIKVQDIAAYQSGQKY